MIPSHVAHCRCFSALKLCCYVLFADIFIYDNKHIWSNEFGKVYIKEDGSPIRPLVHITDARALAYDWLGHKLYWSSLRPGVLVR